MLYQCRYSLVVDLLLDTHLSTSQESLWVIQTCQIESKQLQHHMEHKLFPHNRNEGQQSSCLFNFLEPLQHQAAALVSLWWKSMQVYLPLNVSPSGKFQVVIWCLYCTTCLSQQFWCCACIWVGATFRLLQSHRWHKLPYKSSWCTHKTPPFGCARSYVQSE